MATAQDIIQLKLSVKDEAFDVQSLSDYHLYLSLGCESFKVTIIDIDTNRCKYLEEYQFPASRNSRTQISHLNWIFEEHHFLKADSWRNVFVSIGNTPFSLVPYEIFDARRAPKYLLYLSQEVNPEWVLHYPHKNIPAVNVFAIDIEIRAWFDKMYPNKNIKFLPQISSFIEAVFQQKFHYLAPQLYILLEGEYFLAVVAQDGKPVLCNSFHFYTAQDFLYYVLFILDELRLSPQECKVNLFGDAEELDFVQHLLSQYVSKISTESKFPEWVNFTNVFDNIPINNYIEIFGLHLCQ
ncbi:MAG: DUF3822 family protein [Microscillaceae bacterium]|nr:DUF3822 family protein [Microscillaceae bacterium]MDW8460070.1 DUF3822 family protein [Cytophagales bacterium]